jgi:hypothetical protein
MKLVVVLSILLLLTMETRGQSIDLTAVVIILLNGNPIVTL